MILNLDQRVLNTHIQKYANSCVPMCVELALKLMGVVNLDYYDLQNEMGDVPRGGKDYDGRIIFNTEIKIDFNVSRGPSFPLNDLFNVIRSEINNGGYVNCAIRPQGSNSLHAYVIYGYQNNGEFLAISTDFKQTKYEFIDNMKTRLKNEQGSDILTFNRL